MSDFAGEAVSTSDAANDLREDELHLVVDPDVDLHDERQRAESRPRQWDLIVATATGGVIGAESRYATSIAIPHAPTGFPWSTVLINVTGCLCIGVLMVVLLELTSPHRLVRPFLGVGVLGGFTTFSTFAVDAQRLVLDRQPLMALLYVILTACACLVAVWLSTVGTRVAGRSVLDRRTSRHRRDNG